MGTPDFAVPSLQILHQSGYEIVGVITATDKLGGRGGKQLLESAVKKYAIKQGLKLLQPKNLKSPIFLKELESLKADLQIVVAFRMLPEAVWNMPKHGTYNLHGSLLPKYRGAAPINWAVIHGETKTGVTAFKLKHAIDTGDIVLQKELTILSIDTAGTIHNKMMYLAATTVLETVQRIEIGEIQYTRQDESKISKAPKLNAENCEIDFNQNKKNVLNLIRGLSPYPGAFTYLHGKKIIIYKAVDSTNDGLDKILTDNKNYLSFQCADGYIDLTEVKLAGKRKMNIKELLNGYKIKN